MMLAQGPADHLLTHEVWLTATTPAHAGSKAAIPPPEGTRHGTVLLRCRPIADFQSNPICYSAHFEEEPPTRLSYVPKVTMLVAAGYGTNATPARRAHECIKAQIEHVCLQLLQCKVREV